MPWPTGKPAHNRIEPPAPGMRICKKCREAKDEKAGFYGGSHKCRACTLAENKAKHDPVLAREKMLLNSYGLTPNDFEQKLKEQDYCCAICGTTDPANGGRKTGRGGGMKHFCIDHDHDTGAVRGLLCYGCNRSLGLFKDNISNLQNAVNYLQKYQ